MPAASYRTTGDFIGLAIVVVIVHGVPVSHHGHDIGKRVRRTAVLVRVNENAQTLKFVLRPKNGADGPMLFG